MSVLWPRLERAAATEALDALIATGTAPGGGAVRHPAQTYSSAGGLRATDADVSRLRDGIVAAAQDFGFPSNRSQLIGFDRRLAADLVSLMPMSTAEALSRPVWNFTTLVLAPDVTHWRFVDPKQNKWTAERWVCSDRTRHMFGRLWWQATQLGVPTTGGLDTRLLDSLSESDLNQLTERTSIGGCGPLVRATARAVLALSEEERNRRVVRNGSLRLLRLVGVVDPYALDETQLDQLAARAMREAVEAARDLPDTQHSSNAWPPPQGSARSRP